MNVENQEKYTFCRLCLKTPLDEFVLIDQTAREMLDVLLVDTNLNLSDAPLMCKDCTETVKRSLTFKSVCMDSEEMMLSFPAEETRSNVDVRDVEEYNSRNIVLNHDECRFCMKRVKEKNLNSLNILMKEKTFSYMVNKYMFQMNLNITKNPHICLHCRDNMESYFKFLQNCHEIEEKIKKYLQNKGIHNDEKIPSSAIEQFVKDVKTQEICDSISELEKFNKEDSRIIDLLHQNVDKTDNIPFETDNSTLFKHHDISSQKTFDNLKIETKHSDNNQALNIEVEELIIKEEVILTKSNANTKQKTTRGVPRRTIHKCDQCNYQVNHKGHLKKHMLIHKDFSEVQVYQCEYCKYRTKLKHNLAKHMIVHKNPEEVPMYQCDICEFRTKYKNSLKGHSLLHKTSSEVQVYQCDSCEFKTKRRGNFMMHLLVHKDSSEVQMYQCDECEFETRRKMSLKYHMLVHKDSSEVRVYQCDRCEYKTRHKHGVLTHSLVHKDSSEVQMYKCEKCEFETKRNNVLKKHMLVHKNSFEVLMYQCASCNYKTNSRSNLENHTLIHKDLSDLSELQVYKCANCEFQTKHKRSIKSHVLIHLARSKVQTFRCGKCEFETRHRGCLKKHSLSHKDFSDASLTVYQCHDCEFKTKYRGSLRKHVRTHKRSRDDR